jgi:hypothetical protein
MSFEFSSLFTHCTKHPHIVVLSLRWRLSLSIPLFSYNLASQVDHVDRVSCYYCHLVFIHSFFDTSWPVRLSFRSIAVTEIFTECSSLRLHAPLRLLVHLYLLRLPLPQHPIVPLDQLCLRALFNKVPSTMEGMRLGPTKLTRLYLRLPKTTSSITVLARP